MKLLKASLVALVMGLLQLSCYAQELPEAFQDAASNKQANAEKFFSSSGLQLAHPVLLLDKWLPDLSVLVTFTRNPTNIEDTNVKIGFYTLSRGQWRLQNIASIGGYGHYVKVISALHLQTKTGKHSKFFVISQLVGTEYGKRAASLYRTQVFVADTTAGSLDVMYDHNLSRQFIATPEYREDDKSTVDVNGVKNADDLRRRLEGLPW